MMDLGLFALDFWRTVFLGWVALGQTCFVVLYATFPWYRSFLGRALFVKGLMLALITDLFIIHRVLGLPYADAVFTTLYGLLGVGVWWQFLAFVRVRAEGRQHDAAAGDDYPKVSRNHRSPL